MSIYKAGVTDLNNRSVDITTATLTYQDFLTILTRLQTPSQRKTATNATTTVYTQVLNRAASGIPVYSTSPTQGYAKIEVRYGFHTYNAYSQSEYDFVMSTIDGIATQVRTGTAKGENKTWNAINAVINGKATDAQKTIVKEYLKVKGLSKLTYSELRQLIMADSVRSIALNLGRTSTDGKTAYSQLKDKKGDCNATAFVNMACFDALGFNSRITHTSTHTWAWVHLKTFGTQRTDRFRTGVFARQ